MKKMNNKPGIYLTKLKFPKKIVKVRKYNFIKIGQAVNIKNRMDDIKTCNPFNLEIIGFIPIERDKKLLKIEEDKAHNYFSNHHYNGEWYLNIEHLVKDYVKLRIKDLTERETDKEVI